MLGILEDLTKAVVGVVVETPVAIAADVVTLGGALTDREETHTGIYKTVQEADAYKESAKADREQAAQILNDAKRKAEVIKTACEQECAALKHEAESYVMDAKASEQKATAMRLGLGAELNALKAELDKREDSLVRREQEVHKASQENKAVADSLAAKVSATNRIWQG